MTKKGTIMLNIFNKKNVTHVIHRKVTHVIHYDEIHKYMYKICSMCKKHISPLSRLGSCLVKSWRTLQTTFILGRYMNNFIIQNMHTQNYLIDISLLYKMLILWTIKALDKYNDSVARFIKCVILLPHNGAAYFKHTLK